MGALQKGSDSFSELRDGATCPAGRLDAPNDSRQHSRRAQPISSADNMERAVRRVKFVRDSPRCKCTHRLLVAVVAFVVLTAMCTLSLAWCWRLEAELAEVRHALQLSHAKAARDASSAALSSRDGAAVSLSAVLENTRYLPPDASIAQELVWDRVRRAAQDNPKKGGSGKKKRRNGKGRRKCKCRGRRGKTGAQGPPGPRGPSGPAASPGPQASPGPSDSSGKLLKNRYPAAAHYRPPLLEELFPNMADFPELCVAKPEWNGALYGSQTFKISSKPKSPLKFFELDTSHKTGIRLPARKEGNGFVIEESGLYLIYVAVTYRDSKFTQGFSLTVNNVQRMKCFDGIDYLYKDRSEDFNKKERTCDGMGVYYLEKGAYLEIRNLYQEAVIDLTAGATYFGLVQLAPPFSPPSTPASP